MQIVTPFLQWLELYNGMTMAPAEPEAPVEMRAETPPSSLLDTVPALTLVASR
jgi:hypothetical protein